MVKKKHGNPAPPTTTAAGDEGTTDLLGGARVAKDHPRIELLGTLDELAAQLQLAAAFLPEGPLRQRAEAMVDLIAVAAAESACSTAKDRDALPCVIEAGDVAWLEETSEASRRGAAIAAGFSRFARRAAAMLNVARTVARRAERRLVTLHRAVPPPGGQLLPLLNRMGEALFALAREAETDGPDAAGETR
jgi:ATP:cob(I)alamin adenosyltransferase